jgi:hypothetical protein
MGGAVMKLIRLVLGAILLAAAGCGTPGNPEAEGRAVESASEWLELVDNGQYERSWQEAAGYFRSAVSQEGWEQNIGAVRKPLGAVVSRKVKSKTYATSLPGAPDGEYVVIQYETVFDNKQASVETVTPMRDSDGTWRVSGYYVN